MQTFLMIVILLSLVGNMILLFAFQNMKLDDRKWYINIALFVFLFLLLNALAYSFEAAHGGEIYLQMPSVPIGVWWCVVGVIDALLIWEGLRLKKMRTETIRQNSIKEAMNVLPIGICYFMDDGMLKLCNEQMYRLFQTLTHRDLQKQEELKEALQQCERYGVSRINNKEIYLFPDGKAWSYRENEVTDRKGKVYTEAIFLDITKQYEEKINLTKQTEKLKEISKELRYLSDNVLILTREREVLAAKTKLHDQMGAGLTAIRQSLVQENADYKDAVRLLRQAVNAIWNDNQYPLEEGDFERFLQDAKTLGVEVVCEGTLPESEELANVCVLAMRECLTNGVCHASATKLWIEMQNENQQCRIRITNNGETPDKEIVPKGGLYNISRHVFDYGGEMQIQSFPYFALTIAFQKERV